MSWVSSLVATVVVNDMWQFVLRELFWYHVKKKAQILLFLDVDANQKSPQSCESPGSRRRDESFHEELRLETSYKYLQYFDKLNSFLNGFIYLCLKTMDWSIDTERINYYRPLSEAEGSWVVTSRSLILICLLLIHFVVVYLLQVLGLKCRQFEMDISSAYSGSCSGEYMLAPFPCCAGKDSVLQHLWH